jgi:alpha-D-ribose 1-methylphosphonate 5-triphosphate synthase subunit PhnI
VGLFDGRVGDGVAGAARIGALDVETVQSVELGLPVEVGAVGVAEGGELGAALGFGDVVRKYEVFVRAGQGLSVGEVEG